MPTHTAHLPQRVRREQFADRARTVLRLVGSLPEPGCEDVDALTGYATTVVACLADVRSAFAADSETPARTSDGYDLLAVAERRAADYLRLVQTSSDDRRRNSAAPLTCGA